MTQRVAVTGASGYIGHALIKELLCRNIEPIAVCRTPLPECPAGVQLLQVKEYADTPTFPDTALVHLAESSLVSEVEQRGESYILETSNNTAALLAKNPNRFVYVSSSLVYGTKSSKPHGIQDPVTRNCVYTRAKLESEKLVIDAGGVVARIGNVYGLPVKPRTVFSDILDQLPKTGPVHIRDENPARDYLWVGDIAKGLADIALGTTTGIYNLGSGVAVSAGDIARKMLAIHDSGNRDMISIATLDTKSIDVIALDSTKTTNNFGWQPDTTINEGLAKLVRSIK